MLLPGFFSYAFDSRRVIVLRTTVFYLGLVTTLVPLGALAGGLGAFVGDHRSTFGAFAGWTLVALGLWQVSGAPLPGRTSRPARSSSAVAVYLLGTAYGLAGACSGPLLGSVLTYAAFGSSPVYGALLMALYGLGMTLPLVVLAVLWQRFPRARGLVRPRPIVVGPVRTTAVQVASGAVTAGIGLVLLVTGGFEWGSVSASVDTQVALEQRAAHWAASISDTTFLGVLLLIGAGVYVVAMRRR
jgi:cytochrome c-type biogenesis protein